MAVKMLKKIHMKIMDIELIKREIEVLKLCQHPNINRLLDIFENQEYLYIVVDLLHIDLYPFLGRVVIAAAGLLTLSFTVVFFALVERVVTGFHPLRPLYCSIYEPSFSGREIEAIFSGNLYAGMSELAFLATWGLPEGMFASSGTEGVNKRYTFRRPQRSATVDNGMVAAWEE